MKLSRFVTETMEFIWCDTNYVEMSDEYREIRRKTGRDLMDKCFWCHHPFGNGELMALARPRRGSNKVLCQTCAGILTSRESPDIDGDSEKK